MLDHILKRTDYFIQNRPRKDRKEIGQFFTSKETAVFMAQQIDIPFVEELCILDPGAGSGILSVALVDRIQQISQIRSIKLTCYENNPDILDLLKSNLEYLKMHSEICLEYEIIMDHYIVSQKAEFSSLSPFTQQQKKYDIVIGNPPYKKILKDDESALAMPSICYGAPNLYFLFAGMSLFNLKENGQMVYIIPRSWTSGAYFAKFREYFLSEGRLASIHLFVSRNKVFVKEDVLQETIIIKVVKTRRTFSQIKLTSSVSNHDFMNVSTFFAPYDLVVNGKENYVYLVTTKEDVEVVSKISSFGSSMPKRGLKMKTGLTVDFRSYEYLRQKAEKDVIPLLYSQHIQNGKIIFPIGKENEYITTQVPGLVQKNKNYLLVKRFTAKEEKRRLQCGIYLSSEFSEYQKISTQNKLNFIERIDGREMSKELTYGLYVIFNSTLYDSYYRILNGSTQVNSSEINSIPIPDNGILEELGHRLMKKNDLSTAECDKLLEEVFNGVIRSGQTNSERPWIPDSAAI